MQAAYTPPEQAWPLEAKLEELREERRGLEERWLGLVPGSISGEFSCRDAPRLERTISKLEHDRALWEQGRAEETESPSDISRKWRDGAYDLAQQRKILFRVFAAVRVDRDQKGCRTPSPGRLHPVWNPEAFPYA